MMVLPRAGKIATDSIDLLARFDYYAETFRHQDSQSNSKLIILLGIDKSEYEKLDDVKFSNLEVFRVGSPTWNFLAFGIKSRFLLHRFGINPALLIAGDMHAGFLSSIVFSALSKARIPIQVSIHGSPGANGKSLVGYFKRFSRRILFKFLISRADSIRVVSKFLQKDISKKYTIEEKKFVIAPIPIMNYPMFVSRTPVAVNVGFVGRLHYERNLEEAMQIVDRVVGSEQIKRVIIIGDGPLRSLLDTWHQKHHYREKILILGSLTQKEMQSHWSEIDVLIGCAVSEGYGLALREAVVSGAIAIARENPGTLELKHQFPGSVYLYRSVEQASAAIQESGTFLAGITKENTFDVQQQLDHESVSRLAQSWAHI